MPEVAPNSYAPDQTTLNILSARARGATMTNAGAVCNVSSSTVRRKLATARQEWGVASNVQAVVTAVKSGLI